LAKPDWKEYELNELGWWARWAELEWVGGDCYTLFSEKFREPFFNRGGFLGLGEDLEGLVDTLERRFRKRRVAPRVLVRDAPDWRPLGELLAKRGYKVVDSMSVMRAGRGAGAPNPEVHVETATWSLEEWSRTYLKAFYGKAVLSPVVRSILEKAVADEKVSLLIAHVGGNPVGCAAVHRTEGLLGAYCIGTVPKFRGKKVGSTLLGVIRRLAKKERRELILQTMLSDSVEVFYLKNGFGRVYVKKVFEKRRSR